jgi:hypothetical protein
LEIRVAGTRERLRLGSYAASEAAAACLLRGPAGGHLLNFPGRAACYAAHHHRGQLPLSPLSVQRVASDAGMAAEAQLLEARSRASPRGVDNSVIARGGEESAGEPPPTTTCSDYHPGAAAMTNWCTVPRADGSRSSGAGTTSEYEHQLVYGDKVHDMHGDIDVIFESSTSMTTSTISLMDPIILASSSEVLLSSVLNLPWLWKREDVQNRKTCVKLTPL